MECLSSPAYLDMTSCRPYYSTLGLLALLAVCCVCGCALLGSRVRGAARARPDSMLAKVPSLERHGSLAKCHPTIFLFVSGAARQASLDTMSLLSLGGSPHSGATAEARERRG